MIECIKGVGCRNTSLIMSLRRLIRDYDSGFEACESFEKNKLNHNLNILLEEYDEKANYAGTVRQPKES